MRPRQVSRLWLALAGLALLSALGGAGTWAAFAAIGQSASNSFASGTVSLTDNDDDTAMLSLTSARPGDADTACIVVSYAGSLPASVRLYGTTTGTGLAEHLDLEVTRGRFAGAPPAFDSCAGFAADAADHVGAGPGVVYRGTLEGLGDDHAAGVVDPSTWTTGDERVYRFELTLRDDPAAQGKDAGQSFTWEARNA